MKESSKEILKEALSEQMEAEANAVPSEEEIRREHIFSSGFLETMRALVKKQEQMEREKEGKYDGKPKDARYEEKQEEKESRVLTGFTEKLANRTVKRILTACIVCVILLGAGVFGYQGLLRAGSSSSSDSASVMTAMDESEEETAEEETADVTEETAEVTEDADADSGDDGEITAGGAGDGSSETSGETDEFGTDITLEGADMTVENVTDHSILICLSNDTGGEFTYGEAYAIECYDEETNTWVLLEAEQNAGFDEAAYILSDGEECTQEADWTDLYGNLEAGTYRVVKEVQSEADGTIYTLAVAFVVE